MHGNNLATLYKHIDQEILPTELGGLAPPYNVKSWAHTLIGKQDTTT